MTTAKQTQDEGAAPPAVGSRLDRRVRRHNEERCSYSCPYYQDGAVLSLCNKHAKTLRYDGQIPPLLAPECKAELTPNAKANLLARN